MSHTTPTTLLTGATGFLGHFILRELLTRGRRVVTVLRAPLDETRQRLWTMMNRIGVDCDHYEQAGLLVTTEGALPDDLPDGKWGATDDILSCAASLQLHSNGNGEPFRTNVNGIEMLLDWARRHHVRRFHAVSTAYVCGGHKAGIREMLHAEPPTFQTDYERSKWTAEQMVTEWGKEPGNLVTLLRPSFLIGHSETGYTTQFGGFYQFARIVAMMTEHFRHEHKPTNGDATCIPHRIPGRKTDPVQNLVPVDFAARIAAEVVLDPSLHGRIYHLTDPNPPTWDDFRVWLEKYFNIYGGEFIDSDEMSNGRSRAESLLWEKYDLLLPRLHHHVLFDQSNTRDVMNRHGIEFPRLDQSRFNRLLDYAATQKWGQKNGRDHNGTHRKSKERKPASVASL